jgi:hypothetical protein
VRQPNAHWLKSDAWVTADGRIRAISSTPAASAESVIPIWNGSP